jgi:glutaminyl-tRNA synthetase
LFIEQDDFMEDPPKRFFRLAPGREVRLIGAYYITCNDVMRDENGRICELRCTYDPESRGGSTPDGRKVKGTIHWVSALKAVPAEIRLYDTLFVDEFPEAESESGDFIQNLNPDSLVTLTGSMLEQSLAASRSGQYFQFMRQGYFVVDSVDSSRTRLVFNRTLPLRDTWAKIQKQRK